MSLVGSPRLAGELPPLALRSPRVTPRPFGSATPDHGEACKRLDAIVAAAGKDSTPATRELIQLATFFRNQGQLMPARSLAKTPALFADGVTTEEAVQVDLLRQEVHELISRVRTAARRVRMPDEVYTVRDSEFSDVKERIAYLNDQKRFLLQQLVSLLQRRVSALEVVDGAERLVERYGSVDELLAQSDALTEEVIRLRLRELRFAVDPLLSRTPGLPAQVAAAEAAKMNKKSKPVVDEKKEEDEVAPLDDTALRVLLAALQNELARARETISEFGLKEADTEDVDAASAATLAVRNASFEDVSKLCARIFKKKDEVSAAAEDAAELKGMRPGAVGALIDATVRQKTAADNFPDENQWEAPSPIVSMLKKGAGDSENRARVLPILGHVEAVHTSLVEEVNALRSSITAHASLSAATQEIRLLVLEQRSPQQSSGFNTKTKIISDLLGQQVDVLMHLRRMHRLLAARDATLGRQQAIIDSLIRQKAALERRVIKQNRELREAKHVRVHLEEQQRLGSEAVSSLMGLSSGLLAQMVGADGIDEELEGIIVKSVAHSIGVDVPESRPEISHQESISALGKLINVARDRYKIAERFEPGDAPPSVPEALPPHRHRASSSLGDTFVPGFESTRNSPPSSVAGSESSFGLRRQSSSVQLTRMHIETRLRSQSISRSEMGDAPVSPAMSPRGHVPLRKSMDAVITSKPCRSGSSSSLASVEMPLQPYSSMSPPVSTSKSRETMAVKAVSGGKQCADIVYTPVRRAVMQEADAAMHDISSLCTQLQDGIDFWLFRELETRGTMSVAALADGEAQTVEARPATGKRR